ncbi:MAG: Na+/H+ antiporter NhaC family protein, partial [Muribaculaceae bacterium]
MKNNTEILNKIGTIRGLLALSPVIIFLLFYLVVSIVIGDFYKMPISIAFIVASMWAIITTYKDSIAKRIEIFSKGAANENILYMIWIFILAGAFAALAKGIGSIDATVSLTLNILPAEFLIPGIFLASCFISISIGTSVGTVVALTPFAVQLA